MPEPSDSDRRKAAQMEPWLAQARLVDALERGWTLHFRCQFCGASRTWHRDTMLGRARRLLGATLADVQAKAACPRCPGRMPILTMSGVRDPGPQAQRLREAVICDLLDAGLNPSALGYGWRPTPAGR